jgi:hypothetical protein
MLGQAPWNPVSDLLTQLQTDVGQLLQAKQRLLIMQRSSVVTIKQEAQRLLAVQSNIERELPEVTSIISKVESDAYTYGDIASAGIFLYEMEKQLIDVDDLARDYMAQDPNAQDLYSPTLGQTLSLSSPYVIMGAFGLLLYFISKRRR